MTAQPWMTPSAEPIPPDALPLAKDAVDNLNDNARMLADYQTWAEAENNAIAEMLINAAKAYEEIDNEYQGRSTIPAAKRRSTRSHCPPRQSRCPRFLTQPSTPNCAKWQRLQRCQEDRTAT